MHESNQALHESARLFLNSLIFMGGNMTEYTFEQFEMNPILKRGVQSMGFDTMTPIQSQTIPLLLEGKDVIGQAQTGTGKTAAFGLPILEKIDPENKHLQALIVCPTRELAMQAANELRNFAKYMQGIRVLPIYGGQDIKGQIRALKGVQVVVGTPGRIMDHMRRHTIKMKDVSMVVLDEADEMLNMGFREDMEVILGAIDHPHQTCLFSATMPKAILEITDQYQNNPIFVKVTPKELTMDRIQQYYYGVKKEYKYEALKRLLNQYSYAKCIVFCNTKSMVDDLCKKMLADGYNAGGLHGDLNQKSRDFVMRNFREHNIDYLVCTDVAARGIDVDDVEAVINYDVPQEIEFYVHRIGRTGRAGKDGISHTICTNADFKRLHQIEQLCHTTIEERSIPTLKEISVSRLKLVLNSIANVVEEDDVDYLISPILKYCSRHDISLEEFCAACIKKELGTAFQEELDIGLSKFETKKKTNPKVLKKKKRK